MDHMFNQEKADSFYTKIQCELIQDLNGMFDKRFKIEEMLKFIVEDELKLILKKN